jgi:hypothetical protein
VVYHHPVAVGGVHPVDVAPFHLERRELLLGAGRRLQVRGEPARGDEGERHAGVEVDVHGRPVLRDHRERGQQVHRLVVRGGRRGGDIEHLHRAIALAKAHDPALQAREGGDLQRVDERGGQQELAVQGVARQAQEQVARAALQGVEVAAQRLPAR